MIKKLILISIFFSLCVAGKAQTTPPDTTYQPYKWEIGTDLLWLVRRNSAPYSVFVRMQRKNKPQAYRLRMNGNFRENLNPHGRGKIHGGATGLNKTELNLFLSLGKEWQKQVKNFVVFYGSDVFSSYSLIREEFNILPGHRYFPITKDLKLGLSPFVGIKYFLHPHLSLSSEAHLQVAYQQVKVIALDFSDPNVPFDYVATSEKKDQFLKAQFYPFYIFSLNYHF